MTLNEPRTPGWTDPVYDRLRIRCGSNGEHIGYASDRLNSGKFRTVLSVSGDDMPTFDEALETAIDRVVSMSRAEAVAEKDREIEETRKATELSISELERRLAEKDSQLEALRKENERANAQVVELAMVLDYLVKCHDAATSKDRDENRLARAHLEGAWADAREALESPTAVPTQETEQVGDVVSNGIGTYVPVDREQDR
jgi:hypothetical protein